MTYMNVGFTKHFYIDWLTSLLSALLVMALIGLIMITLINKLIAKLLPNTS
ncbi:DUF2798 domain-containing protein [Pseudoalteromonas aliena]|uniref:DUF2798 domain-containing protein n=1 Tax=Pseudoalteromonas aliena TaxID=247523 RepID=UPI00311F076D